MFESGGVLSKKPPKLRPTNGQTRILSCSKYDWIRSFALLATRLRCFKSAVGSWWGVVLVGPFSAGREGSRKEH